MSIRQIVIKRAASLLFLLIATLVFLSACGEQQPPAKPSVVLSGLTMGTSYNITVVEPVDATIDVDKLQLIIDTRLATLNQQLSTYIDSSELSQFNRGGTNIPIAVSDELFDILMLSLELSWLSNGAFDISIGPLVDLWGFGTSKSEAVPSDAEIESKLAVVGFQSLELNIGDNSVLKLKPVSIDLSAIAKGYGVDKISEILRAAGYKDFMVEIGGELYLQGNSPRGTPWRIAIEKPDGSFGQVQQTIAISNAAMATSGDYRNYFEVAGKRYSHTIDPLTGRPITHNLASVTVIADTAAYADGLATAINVLGAEKGLALARQQGIALFLIIKTERGFETHYTDAFKPYLD